MMLQGMNKLHLARFLLLLLLCLTAGCALPIQRPDPAAANQPVFIPPTLSPTLAPTPSPTPLEKVSENKDCTNNLRFISDVTIPDGTLVQADSTLDKRWEVENNGTCNWDSRYRIRLVAGEAMETAKELALYPARAGSRAALQIRFKAPSKPARYRSAWQAFGPDGQPFGDQFFLEIVVKPPEQQ
jgi:hypothetical protein